MSMKVKILREFDGNFKKDGTPSIGRPIGLVVALSKKEVGVAFWSKRKGSDQFDKNFLKNLAAGRAVMREPTKIPNREIELSYAPGVFVSLCDYVEGEVAKTVGNFKGGNSGFVTYDAMWS